MTLVLILFLLYAEIRSPDVQLKGAARYFFCGEAGDESPGESLFPPSVYYIGDSGPVFPGQGFNRSGVITLADPGIFPIRGAPAAGGYPDPHANANLHANPNLHSDPNQDADSHGDACAAQREDFERGLCLHRS